MRFGSGSVTSCQVYKERRSRVVEPVSWVEEGAHGLVSSELMSRAYQEVPDVSTKDCVENVTS